MDHKMAAANDEQGILVTSGMQSEKPVSPEFVAEAIEHLETFTGRQLSTTETAHWKERLLKYPRWKLLELHEYTGGLTNEVFRYLDGITRVPQTVHAPALPEPKSNIAKDFFAHVQALGSAADFKPTVFHENDPEEYARQRSAWVDENRAAEKKSLQALHVKYPHGGFDRAIRLRDI